MKCWRKGGGIRGATGKEAHSGIFCERSVACSGCSPGNVVDLLVGAGGINIAIFYSNTRMAIISIKDNRVT